MNRFSLKKVETSNTVYITRYENNIINIETKIDYTIEPINSTPQIEFLKQYLSKHIYLDDKHQTKKMKVDIKLVLNYILGLFI